MGIYSNILPEIIFWYLPDKVGVAYIRDMNEPNMLNETKKADKKKVADLNIMFPFQAGDRPISVETYKIESGELVVVNDVFQMANFEENVDFQMTERAVSGCCILRVRHDGGVRFFHIPAGDAENLLQPGRSMNERLFVNELSGSINLSNPKFDYYTNGFHNGSEQRRTAAIRSIHQRFFADFGSDSEIHVIHKSDGSTTDDLSESIDITFSEEKVILPEGYKIKQEDRDMNG